MSGIARGIALGLPPILANGPIEGSKPSSQMKTKQLTKKPGRKPKTQISMVSPDFAGQDHDDICCKNRDRSEATSHSNCGCVVGRHVAPTTEHNRFSIVWVFQASDDIQFPCITLIGGVIQCVSMKKLLYWLL